jgi:P27 family predicted phage terminase small subunit
MPPAPEWLTEIGRRIWSETLEAAPAGLLKRLDVKIFTGWVEAAALHEEACRIQAGKPLFPKTRKGSECISPVVTMINRQVMIMAKLASELGFTPSSRARVTIDAPDSDDGAAKYLT